MIIDRTSWQFGKTVISIFVLAVVHDGVTYSQIFSMLPKAMKNFGFNMEDTNLTSPERVSKVLLPLMKAFVWCYNIGELEHWKIKPIRILKNGRKKSIISYGLDIVADYLQRGRNEFKIP